MTLSQSIAALEDAVAALTARVEALEAAPPKRDVSGTTSCGTERAAVSAKRDHAAAWSGIGFNTKEIQG